MSNVPYCKELPPTAWMAVFAYELELQRRYPSIVEEGSPAYVRFRELFRALWTPGIDVMALADFVMVYEPRTHTLPSEAADPTW